MQDDNSVVSLFAKELDRYNRRVGKAMDAATQTEPALRYSAQVVRVYNSLSLTGSPERDPRLNQLPLDDIFVTLSVDIDVSEPSSPANGFEPSKPDDPLAPRGQRSAEMRLRQRAPPVPQRLSVGEALSRYRRLVIVGAPGGGKTTLLRWLAVTFASERQAEPNRLGPNFAAPYIPVVLELRRFADRFASLTEQPATFDLAAEASAFIAQDARFAGTPSELIHDAIVAGRCLILLDGLDEIADQATRRRLIEAIEALCLDPQRGSTGNLCLLTTRPHGFVNLALGAGFQTVTVRPFEAEDVATFTRTWYRIAYGDDALADEAQDLIAAIQANDRVAGLASNPLLCTIIAIVYRNNRVLPERRVELYLKCCEALLDTWERNKDIKSSGLIGGFGWQIKLELLAALAYWMHGETERLAAADDLVVEQIARALEADEIARPGSAEDEARHFIETIRDRSGLLRGRGDGTLEFSHRTFQEYLAARHVATLEDEAMLDAVMPHLHAAWWEEVHLLLFGHLGSGKENSGRVERLALCILDATPHPLPFLMPPRHPWLSVLAAGRWFPGWQRNARIGQLLGRNLTFAIRGYSQCAVTARPAAVTERLAADIQRTLRRWRKRPVAMAVAFPLVDAVSVGSLGDRLRAGFRATLLEALRDSAYNVRSAAALALGAAGAPTPAWCRPCSKRCETAPAMCDPPRRWPWARRGAPTRWCRPGVVPARVVPALLEALRDSTYDVRSAAAQALGAAGGADPGVVPALLEALRDSADDVRSAAAQALGAAGGADPCGLVWCRPCSKCCETAPAMCDPPRRRPWARRGAPTPAWCRPCSKCCETAPAMCDPPRRRPWARRGAPTPAWCRPCSKRCETAPTLCDSPRRRPWLRRGAPTPA